MVTSYIFENFIIAHKTKLVKSINFAKNLGFSLIFPINNRACAFVRDLFQNSLTPI